MIYNYRDKNGLIQKKEYLTILGDGDYKVEYFDEPYEEFCSKHEDVTLGCFAEDVDGLHVGRLTVSGWRTCTQAEVLTMQKMEQSAMERKIDTDKRSLQYLKKTYPEWF